MAGRELLDEHPAIGKSDLQDGTHPTQEDLSKCLNSSNTTAADATNTLLTAKLSVAEVPLHEQDHALCEIRGQCIDYSNTGATVADVPLCRESSPTHPDIGPGKPDLHLNSSNIVGSACIELQPALLSTLVNCFLLNHFDLDEDQVMQMVRCHTKHNPSCLKAMATSTFQKNYPGIDIDLALTNLTKYNIVHQTFHNFDESLPSLDLNALLKTLALKHKMEELVPKVGCSTVNRWTKKVPHWMMLPTIHVIVVTQTRVFILPK